MGPKVKGIGVLPSAPYIEIYRILSTPGESRRYRVRRNRHWTIYIVTDIRMKPVSFLGDSLDVIRSFPDGARRDVGYQIDRVQRGLEPDNWKPMKTIGTGVREIRIREATGAFRVIYLATHLDVVFVLHAFQKKSRATSKRDLEIAATRFKDLMRRHRQ